MLVCSVFSSRQNEILTVAGIFFVCAMTVSACAEKKNCFTQCYEPALDGYGDGCGFAEQVTEKECRTHQWCDTTEYETHTSWGEVPDWCSDNPEKYRKLNERGK